MVVPREMGPLTQACSEGGRLAKGGRRRGLKLRGPSARALAAEQILNPPHRRRKRASGRIEVIGCSLTCQVVTCSTYREAAQPYTPDDFDWGRALECFGDRRSPGRPTRPFGS